MNSQANNMEGIQTVEGNGDWEAVDVLWCDNFSVDGYLAADYYGEVLSPGWYYEPLMRVDCGVYAPFEHDAGPRGPYLTSGEAHQVAAREALGRGATTPR